MNILYVIRVVRYISFLFLGTVYIFQKVSEIIQIIFGRRITNPGPYKLCRLTTRVMKDLTIVVYLYSIPFCSLLPTNIVVIFEESVSK